MAKIQYYHQVKANILVRLLSFNFDMKRICFILSFSLLLVASGCEASPSNKRIPGVDAEVGLQIRSLKTGKVLYAHNADKTFIPASTLKVFTAATALSKLKPSYRFETEVFHRGGTLYLKGSGDPEFSVHELDDLAGRIKQLVHRKINRIIVDASVFDKNYYGQGWSDDDSHNGYAAPVAGINVNYNRIVLGFLPGKKVIIDPLTDYVKLKTTSKGIFKLQGHGVSVSGNIPRVTRPWYKTYAIKDPIQWAGFLFEEALRRAGVKLSEKVLIQVGKYRLS